MSTDAHILFGTDEAVKLQAEKSPPPVYYYYFDYRGTNSRSSLYGDFNNDYGKTVYITSNMYAGFSSCILYLLEILVLE